ncbi:MAG TPA: hypothetical protein VGQ36_17910 [Thermoanaerobaculia bacterium]|jgi:hypothetical protein|nr:hypothetical protein [Thermoanaerobaculia bacterium]
MNDKDIFINCPFDRPYRPLLRGLVFAVHDCGFKTRSALEVEDSGEVRVQKIVRIIGESPYAIHDISRVEPDPKTKLPRFNMPLELGMYLGAKAFGDSANQLKRCIVLDEDQFRYQSFCSDIAGQDIRAHGGKVNLAIEIVRNWLFTTPPATGTVIPSGSVIAQRYKLFRATLPVVCEKLQLNPRRLTFGDDVTLVIGWLKENPWKPTA